MTRVLALADQSKIGCITQRRFAKVGTKTHPQRGAALDRNGLSVSTETACRFEPKSPVGNSEICRYFYDWRDDGLFEKINFELLLQTRAAAGREASPSAGMIDSQSVKT